jgi:hypothetical protein
MVFPAMGAVLAGLADSAIGQMSASAAMASPVVPGEFLQDRPDGLLLGPGVHLVPRDTEIHADMVLLPGARIEVANAATLSILGHFNAPVAPVFQGEGRVDLNAGRTPAAFPEWWGAQSNDSGADCRPAISACIQAHPLTMLQAADYYLADTLVVDRPHRRVWGAGYRGTRSGEGTRLIVASGVVDVVRVGPAEKPSQVNDFIQGVDLRWMDLTRSQQLDGRANPQPAGLRAQFLLFCQFEGISSSESGSGFVATGVVRSYFRDCIAFRSFDATSSNAPWRGFLLDGNENIGLAGGNASIYLTDCNASVGGEPNISDGVGLLLSGAFSDSFIVNFETTGVATGIRLDGQQNRIGGRAVAGHANVHIRMPIIDQCSAIGIEVRDTSEHALVELNEPYIGLAPKGQAGIVLNKTRGAVSISGGQILGGMNAQAKGNGIGLEASDSSGIMVHGFKLLDLQRPVVLERCCRCTLRCWINNPMHEASQAAVTVENCSRSVIDVLLGGKRGAFPAGISITGTSKNAALQIEATGLDPDAMTEPPARVTIGNLRIPVPGRKRGVSVVGE